MNKYFAGKTVWIVGASSGIGEAVALAFAKGGSDLILSSRRESELERVRKSCETLGASCLVLPFDVSDPDEIAGACRSLLEGRKKTIDILVLNSGISQRAPALDTALDVDRRIMEVNYFGLIDIAKRVTGHMLMKGTARDKKWFSPRGHIVVTSSLSGAFGMPNRSAYAASKHALNGFFESLRAEYGRHGLNVTILMPGSIRTGISRSALLGDGAAYGRPDERLERGMPPEKAAGMILKAVRQRRKEAVIAGPEGLLFFIRRFFPSLFYRLAEKAKDK